MEFDLGDRGRNAKVIRLLAGCPCKPIYVQALVRTNKSKYPSGQDPNFAVKLLVPIQVSLHLYGIWVGDLVA